jgi:hypothetical protein
MSYLLYSTDPPSHVGVSPDLGHVHPLTLPSLGEAIAAACLLVLRGSVVWQISGSDGFMMERRDIEIECERRECVQASRRAIASERKRLFASEMH